MRRDGRRFPGEATVTRVDGGGEVFVSGFITDVTERVRRQAEREALLREQAARAQAERVAEIVGRMQALVDAALAQRSLAGILTDLVAQVREVLEAGAATIYLSDDGRPPVGGRLDRRRRPRSARSSPAVVATSREEMLAEDDALDRRAAAGRGRGHGGARGRRRAAAASSAART